MNPCLHKPIALPKSFCWVNYFDIMNRLSKKFEKQSDAESLTSNSSFLIPEHEIQRVKKRKKAAFQSFLTKPQLDSDEKLPPRRKLSDHEMEDEVESVVKTCKICDKILKDKVKICEFCKDTMCIIHFRKARRHPTTNKFSRICDSCEDTKLMQRHCQSLMKNEQTLATEELVVFEKHCRLKQSLASKRIQLDALKRKRKQIQSRQLSGKENEESILEKAIQQVNESMKENQFIQRRLIYMQEKLPHSEEEDYNILSKQREKLTKQLNRITRQCESEVKAKAEVQEKMYEDLYEWQLLQKYKIQQSKKKDNCTIY